MDITEDGMKDLLAGYQCLISGSDDFEMTEGWR